MNYPKLMVGSARYPPNIMKMGKRSRLSKLKRRKRYKQKERMSSYKKYLKK
jgi:hypothetical protein